MRRADGSPGFRVLHGDHPLRHPGALSFPTLCAAHPSKPLPEADPIRDFLAVFSSGGHCHLCVSALAVVAGICILPCRGVYLTWGGVYVSYHGWVVQALTCEKDVKVCQDSLDEVSCDSDNKKVRPRTTFCPSLNTGSHSTRSVPLRNNSSHTTNSSIS